MNTGTAAFLRCMLLMVIALGAARAGDAPPPPSPATLPTVTLRIGHHRIVAEVAATDETRARGLMYRKQPLAEDRGMLFVFDNAGFHGMWMKNTYIPLSVAFLDEAGRILNIADMTPLTTHAHTAAGFARYALEVNRGWFAARGIAPGARLQGLEALSAAPPAR